MDSRLRGNDGLKEQDGNDGPKSLGERGCACPLYVFSAQAGTMVPRAWIPAYAGMTGRGWGNDRQISLHGLKGLDGNDRLMSLRGNNGPKCLDGRGSPPL